MFPLTYYRTLMAEFIQAGNSTGNEEIICSYKLGDIYELTDVCYSYTN